MKTTVIVATYPEDKHIDNLVKWFDGKPYPLIVETKEVKRTFAENNNIGASKAETEYLLFLNSDTIPEEGFIEEMEKVLDSNKQFGLVGAKLYFLEDFEKSVKFKGRAMLVKGKKGTVQHAGIVFTSQLLPLEYGRGYDIDAPEVNRQNLVGGVTGACMLVRKQEFLDIGGFDEKFRNGWEDTDLCLRYLQKGLIPFYQPKAKVGHYYAGGDYAGRYDSEDANYNYWIDKWHKSGEIYKLFPNRGQIKLDVGCGGKKKEGFMGVDKYAGDAVDLVFDLDMLHERGTNLPFPDDSVDEIYCAHTLEHTNYPVDILNEFHRVLRSWGTLELVVPHAFSWSAWASPLHKSYFIPETFSEYFASDKQEEKMKTDYQMQTIKPWHIEKLEYTPVPENMNPFDVQREIVVLMRPLK